jgi:ribosomal-protein-serine acetyltransferase
MSTTPVLCIQVNAELQLRLLEERHVEEYFALIERNRTYLREWDVAEAYEGSVDTLRVSVKQHLLQFVEGSGFHLGMWYQGTLAGLLAYHVNRRHRKVELGYWIDASLQGKGLVTEACRTMVRHAFEEGQAQKVEISCAADNTRSRAVPERLGFTQEGVLRRSGWLHDRFGEGVFYGMLLEEWNAGTEQMPGR